MDTATGEVTTEELRRDIAARRDDVGRDLDAIGDRLSPGRIAERTRGRARYRVTMMRERVMGPARGAGSTMGDAKRHLGEQGRDVGSAVKEAPAQALQAVEDRVEGSPLAAGFVALGIGFLAGSLIPGTRRESDLASRLEPELQEATRSVASGAKDAVSEVAGVARDEATDLKEHASDAAHQVSSAAQDHAKAPRDEVSGGTQP
jgi:ElaB/YqjD/DUF883 family membrane-anchored ribosome-binding protein